MLRCRFQTAAAVSVQCSPGSQTSTGDQHSRKRAAEQPALYEQQQRAAAAYQQQALQALQQQQGYQASLGSTDAAAETLHTQMLLAVRLVVFTVGASALCLMPDCAVCATLVRVHAHPPARSPVSISVSVLQAVQQQQAAAAAVAAATQHAYPQQTTTVPAAKRPAIDKSGVPVGGWLLW